MSHAGSRRIPKVLKHRSLDFRRRQFNHREETFAAYWEAENERRSWLNYGKGILQDLMLKRDRDGPFATVTWRKVINNRDAAIVATVMQWLGTNVGMCFLEVALKRCGYRVVRDEAWVNADDCCSICHGRGRKGMSGGKVICGWCRMEWRRARIAA